MLPANYKELILALAEAHRPSFTTTTTTPTTSPIPTTNPTSSPPAVPHQFDYLVQGKGAGLVVLLAGNQGTGKTLTAEAVADTLRRPLYVLGTGELLGQLKELGDVEERVRRVLDRAERWGAVLVLEDCDVLLRERGGGDGVGDGVVVVFSR